MKLVMTLVCGDEPTVIALLVAGGVSTADVADALEAHAREGYVHLACEPAAALPLSERVTRMARVRRSRRASWPAANRAAAPAESWPAA